MASVARACVVVVAVATAVAGGCASATPHGGEGVVARFMLPKDGSMPAFLDVPFPSDVYLRDGRVVEPIPGISDVVTSNDRYIGHELARLDGFGRTTHAFFRVDDTGAPADEEGTVAPADVDPASLPARETDCTGSASAVFLVDMAAPHPSKARVPCRAEYHDDRRFGSTTRPLLAVGPARGVVLEEGHAYAAVVTSRVRAKGGRNVRATAELRSAGGFWGERLRRAETLLAGALEGASIVAIAPFTTHTRARELYEVRDALEKRPVARLAWDAAAMTPMGAARFARPRDGALPPGFTATLDDWLGVVDPKHKLDDGSDDPSNDLPVRAHDRIAAVGTAVFEATSYLRDLGTYATLDHATFERDASGRIVPSATRPKQKIWVTFVVPAAPMPAGGYPALVVQHGMGSSRAYLFDMANEIAKAGFVAVAVDSLTFGARALDAEARVDVRTAYEGAPGARYRGPDGLSDAPPTVPLDLFGQLANLGAFRDQLRQAAMDTVELVRVLGSDPDLSPLAIGGNVPRIDPERVGYLGESLGSIEGEVACAIEPGPRAWFFSVGGGGIILEASAHAPGLGAYIGTFAGLEWHFLRDRFTSSHLLVNLIQTILEPADPLTYAPDLVRAPRAVAGRPAAPRNVALLEVLWDELVANEAAEAFARAAGMPLASPNVGSNAGTVDLVVESRNTGRVPFASAAPDASGAIHDAPLAGITAVVIQASPAGHGYDIVRKQAKRSFAIPYLRADGPTPFVSLGDAAFWVKNPNLVLMETVRRWFGSAFAGGAPRAFVLAAPVRDFDDDGFTDDVDRAPNDPRVH